MTTNKEFKKQLNKQLKSRDDSDLAGRSESSELVEINIIEVPIYETYETFYKDEDKSIEWKENKKSAAQLKAVDGLFNILSSYLKPQLPTGACINKNTYGLLDKDTSDFQTGSVYVSLKLSYPHKLSDLFSDDFIGEIRNFAAEALDNINKFAVIAENEPDEVKIFNIDEIKTPGLKEKYQKYLVVSSPEQQKFMEHAVSFLRKANTDVSLAYEINGKKDVVNIQKAKPLKSFENDELEALQVEAFIINISYRLNAPTVVIDPTNKSSNMICQYDEEHFDAICDIAKSRKKCYLTVRTYQKIFNGEYINDFTKGKILGLSTAPTGQESFVY
tara:strand:- start:15578 stop:16570 length:993 start_codon:yes stop_codon:yes gene_type:complete